MKKILILIALFLLSFIGFADDVKTLVLQPGPQDGFDAYINSVYPDDPGWDKGLLVTAWTLGGEPYIGKALLKFDLSQLLPGDSILDARLNLFFDPLGSWPEHSGDNQAHIYRITDNWDFMTVTWNTQPSFTQSEKVLLPASTEPQQNYTDIDITTFVKIWKSNPDQNFGMIIALDTQDPYANLVFAPCDRLIPSVRPKLVITYISCTSPIADFSFTNQEKVVSFLDQSSSAFSWSWDFGDGNQSNVQNPSHTYVEYGKYMVCLAIQDSCGRDTICDTVNLCYDLNPHYNYSIDNLAVSFYDSSYMPLTWWWNFGDGFYSDLKDPVHTFQKTGKYFVCETVSNNCSTETYCDSVIVCSEVNPHYNYSIDSLVVSFFDSSYMPLTWWWDFGDGYYSELQDPIHAYQKTGKYFVCETVSNYCNTASYCDSVDVRISGIDEFSAENMISIYPNPATDVLTVLLQNQQAGEIKLTIFDVLGRIKSEVIKEMNPGANKIRLDLQNLVKGIYILQVIRDGKGKILKFNII